MRLTVVKSSHATGSLISSIGQLIHEKHRVFTETPFVNLVLIDPDGVKIVTLPFFIKTAMTSQLRWRTPYRAEIENAIEKYSPSHINISVTSEPVMDVINFTHAMDQSVTSFDGNFSLNCRRLKLNNGGEMSVQASPGHYCSPRDMTNTMSYSYYYQFEVGFPSIAVPEFNPYSQDNSIYGWVPASIIQFVVNRCGGTVIPVCEGNYEPKIGGHLIRLSQKIDRLKHLDTLLTVID